MGELACLMLEENINTVSGMEIMETEESLDNRKQGDCRVFFNLLKEKRDW